MFRALVQFSGVRLSSCDKSTDKSDQTGAGAAENNQNIKNEASSGYNEHHSRHNQVISKNVWMMKGLIQQFILQLHKLFYLRMHKSFIFPP